MRSRHGVVIGLFAVTGCELFASVPNGTLKPDGGGSNGDALADAYSHGCEVDTECTTGVCLPDGTCSDPARVLIASTTGTGVACSDVSPCTIQTAIAQVTAQHDIVKLLPGTYSIGTPLTTTSKLLITGYGATITGAASPMFESQTNADTTWVGMTISAVANVAFYCLQPAPQKLTLYKVKVIDAYTATFASTCELAIDRSVIASSKSYGVYAQTQPVTITRSFIVDNGTNPATTFGGLYLVNVPSGTIRDVTIANNHADDGEATGIRCMGSSAVQISNSIIYGNPAPAIDPLCTISHSVVDAGYTGGTANVSLAPGYLGAGDYHLSPQSPVRAMGDPAITPTYDFDGQLRPRPANTAPEPGADEID